MSITPLQLAAALKSMGVAQVFVGDPFTLGGMSNLGMTEGEIRVDTPFTPNNLTAPEFTGGVVHQATVTPGEVTVTVPLIMGDPTLFAKISPVGMRGGGHSSPQKPLETSVLVIPLAELGAGLTYPVGGPWNPAAPQNAFWLWRAYATPGAVPFRYADGGKVITEVVFHGMFYAANPEGHKVWTWGDPHTVIPAIPVVI